MKEASSTQMTRYKPLFLGGIGLAAVIVLSVLSIHVLCRKPSESPIMPGEPAQSRRTANPMGGGPNTAEAKELETDTGSQPSHRPAPVEKDTELPVPEADARNVNLALNRLSNEQYWKEEDKVTQSWPKLEDLREQLAKELRERFDMEEMTAAEFAQIAVDLREKFWRSGGRLSPDSFKDIYLARVLLELGRQRYPEDLTLIDELVETIQSAWPNRVYTKPPSGVGYVARDGKAQGLIMTYDETTMRELFQLRQQQVSLVQTKMQGEYRLGFQDFLRVNDLVRLYQFAPGVNREQARQEGVVLVKWLLENAAQGGWEFYHDELTRLEERLTEGRNHYFNIFLSKDKYRAQFNRRLPSFRGPESRDLIATKDAAAQGMYLTTTRR